MSKHIEETVPLADTMEVDACTCGNLHFRFKDKSGAIFAAAIMPAKSAGPVICQQILDALDWLETPAVKMHRCAGHA